MKLCSGKRRRPRSWRGGSRLSPAGARCGARSVEDGPAAVALGGRLHLRCAPRDEPLLRGPRIGEKLARDLDLLPALDSWLRERRVLSGGRARLASVCFTGTARPSVASRSAAPPTRLETRTKESNTCASHWADEAQRRSESKGRLAAAEGRSLLPGGGRSPGASLRPCLVRSSQSARVGTRKMVNYAWPGRSQGKP